MTLKSLTLVVASGLALLTLSTEARSAKVEQAPAPAPIDTSKIGPRVGQAVPPIDGVDQFGRRQTLASVAGTRGTMLVFFRSADW